MTPARLRVCRDATVIASDAIATSPLSGRRSTCIVIELLDRAAGAWSAIATVPIGDVLTLDVGGETLRVVFRRAEIRFAFPRTNGAPLDRVPAELVPVVTRTRAPQMAARELGWREHLIGPGAIVRVDALVTRTAPKMLVAEGNVVLAETLATPWESSEARE